MINPCHLHVVRFEGRERLLGRHPIVGEYLNQWCCDPWSNIHRSKCSSWRECCCGSSGWGEGEKGIDYAHAVCVEEKVVADGIVAEAIVAFDVYVDLEVLVAGVALAVAAVAHVGAEVA